MCPGIVRRFWWRTSQPARLTIACVGVVAALATTGAAAFSGDALQDDRGNAELDAAMHRGDAVEVIVQKVSDVDSFEGMESATGLSFRARVAGVRGIADCWVTESRDTAQNMLRGKNVKLTVRNDASSVGDRIAVDVRLPDETDYARTVVQQGAAAADLSARGELATVESAARLERRGLWASGCAPGTVTETSSSAPSSPAPSSTTPTTTTPPTTESSAPPSSSKPHVTSSTLPPSETFDGARLGRPCLIEGARWKTEDGGEMVCARNSRNQLRWRRAD
ncbi:thermonuclease family protein [Lentzea sp. NPDC051213]|uniref:thermonuclease family protein n=1 Tax=Lentzea sp. NPDC051213 TaxID=3364126 RepID=UPI0037B156AB